MIIAGLTGGIGHGKTTFASLLAEQCKSSFHFESWELVAEVASALRNENTQHPRPDDIPAVNQWLTALPDIVNWSVHANLNFNQIRLSDKRLAANPEHYSKLFEYLRLTADRPDLTTTPVDATTKEIFRPLLQWLGGYLVVAVGPGIWYDEIVRRITHLSKSGFDLVTVGGVRYPNDAERLRNASGVILQISRPELPERDSRDLTERERSDIEPDSIIVNDGSLAQLADCARSLYSDLCMRQVQPRYEARIK